MTHTVSLLHCNCVQSIGSKVGESPGLSHKMNCIHGFFFSVLSPPPPPLPPLLSVFLSLYHLSWCPICSLCHLSKCFSVPSSVPVSPLRSLSPVTVVLSFVVVYQLFFYQPWCPFFSLRRMPLCPVGSLCHQSCCLQ